LAILPAILPVISPSTIQLVIPISKPRPNV
jgi:hypothetical protein